MITNDKFSKLQLKLCELKLEQRHVNTDMTRLLKGKKTVDFFQARRLSAQKDSLSRKIDHVQASMDPNIIA